MYVCMAGKIWWQFSGLHSGVVDGYLGAKNDIHQAARGQCIYLDVM